MIKINKAIFKEASRIGVGKQWVTQGYWAVKKKEFDAKSQKILKNNDTLLVWLGKPLRVHGEDGTKNADETCELVASQIKGVPLKKFIRTPWQYQVSSSVISILFQGDDEHLFIDAKYVDGLELEEVFSMAPDSVCVVFDEKRYEDRLVIKAVMPMRINDNLPAKRRTSPRKRPTSRRQSHTCMRPWAFNSESLP